MDNSDFLVAVSDFNDEEKLSIFSRERWNNFLETEDQITPCLLLPCYIPFEHMHKCNTCFVGDNEFGDVPRHLPYDHLQFTAHKRKSMSTDALLVQSLHRDMASGRAAARCTLR